MIARRDLRHGRRCAVRAACVLVVPVALATAPPAQHAAAASTATVGVVACSGLGTWTFATPLTLAFTASGSITETWDTPDTCNDVVVSEAAPGQLPWESWAVVSGSNPATDAYSGSCVVASVMLGDSGAGALLLGGVVAVSQGSAGPGAAQAEVDVLATTGPCDETGATAADSELSTLTVLGK